jgi:anthranilate phosphoribosyltransferase
MSNLDRLLTDVADGRDLDAAATQFVFEAIVAGRLAPPRIQQFLIDLSNKGVTVAELVGAARVMRQSVTPVECRVATAIDTCGTGGDGISTFNVSTAAAIVASAAGAVVAKHGNRSHSRRSGSAECLTALGVRTDLSPERLSECLHEIGIAFLHAARLHPAMAIVADIRRQIGRPTIFNLLGPLTNPAGVRRQIIGVPRPELLETMARALIDLGFDRGIVVHGGGLCDFTITGPSGFIQIDGNQVREDQLTPEQLGLQTRDLSELLVESPEQSAVVIRGVLDGNDTAARQHTLLNAAAALWVAGVADDLREGLTLAGHSIDNGAAASKLDQLIAFTNA